MKNYKVKTLIILMVFFLFCSTIVFNSIHGQIRKTIPPTSNATTAFNISQIATSKWDDNDGLKYSMRPGVNLGVTSFEVLDNNTVAYLSNSSNEIIIINTQSGKIEKKIPLPESPVDFALDNKIFYVLFDSEVDCFDQSGAKVRTIPFNKSYIGVNRIIRFHSSTYLLLASGNSVMIESKKSIVTPTEQTGWITKSGNRIVTSITGEHSYSVKVITPIGIELLNSYSTNLKTAGVFVVGSTNNRIILDVQTYISEVPISVERSIVSLELSKSELGQIVATTKVPDVYYTLTSKDFDLSADGSIYSLISAPEGVFVYSLIEQNNKGAANSYPDFLMKNPYHFNNHLLQVD